MYYDFNTILASAEPMDDYWKQAGVDLAEGDTAYAPGTTKKVFGGVGHIEYLISATGWQVVHKDPSIVLLLK